MNHKRGRPKSRRAGCLLCKPHKRQGSKLSERDRPGDRRRKLIGTDVGVSRCRRVIVSADMREWWNMRNGAPVAGAWNFYFGQHPELGDALLIERAAPKKPDMT